MHLHILLYFSMNYLTRKFFLNSRSRSRNRSRISRVFWVSEPVSGPIPGLGLGSRVSVFLSLGEALVNMYFKNGKEGKW